MGKEAAGAMGATSFIGPGLGIAGGIFSAITGAKEKRDADRALANYNRQKLKNVAENLQVSTRGAEVQTENQARLEANQIDALRGGGTRALVAGLGKVEAGSQAVAENIGINLDEQQKQIDQMKAADDARIRAMQENREIADIAALSSQSQAGKDAQMMGFGNIIQGVGSAANQFGAGNANRTSSADTTTTNEPLFRNELSTGVMTKTGGSGMGATSGFGYDEFGNKIATPNASVIPNLRRKKFGLGYTENYDGTLNFN